MSAASCSVAKLRNEGAFQETFNDGGGASVRAPVRRRSEATRTLISGRSGRPMEPAREPSPRFDPSRKKLKVLSWNIQFAASTKHNFFYEGGTAVSVPSADDVHATLDTIAATIQKEDPDIVLLQEVDRGARRTWYIDEHAEVRGALRTLHRYDAPGEFLLNRSC